MYCVTPSTLRLYITLGYRKGGKEEGVRRVSPIYPRGNMIIPDHSIYIRLFPRPQDKQLCSVCLVPRPAI